ncbi:MAG: DoxX family protein [Halothiobacillaceae bacterium]|nr:DoxX family protein [Halothiobacillaceae bacterium]
MPRIPILVIAVFFLAGGVGHLVFTEFFILAMPDYLSHHKELVLVSGAFELLGAVGVLIPQTRLWAGYGLIALIIAVYPANVHMALHPEAYAEMSAWLLYMRLPFQFLFVWFVWWAIAPERARMSNTRQEY